MAILNRILNIVIFLVAIAALVFGYLLSSHRQVARERGDKLAKTLSDVVAAQDADSGTNTKATVSVDNLKWDKFEKESDLVSKAMNDAISQAKGTIEQRNKLAEGISGAGETVGLELKAEDLKDKGKYEEGVTALQERLVAVKGRDAAMIEKINLVASRIKANVDPDALASYDNYLPELENFGKDVGKLKDSNLRMASTITQVVAEADPSQEIGLTQDQIADAPADKLNSLVEKLKELREAYKERDELRIAKQKWVDSEKDLNAQVTAATEARVAAEAALAAAIGGGGTVAPVDQPPAVTPNSFEGSIVSVNYDLNYVIIDLGGKDGLPANIKLSVVRNREFITDVAVTTVYKEYAVADILPDLMEGEVIPGDKVTYFTAN